MQSDDKEIVITELFSERTHKKLKELGISTSKQDTISYRLVKVLLPNGTIEVLLTNLDKDFSIKDLAEIYHLRWGIETAFKTLKSNQMLGTFSGYSPTAIEQDIYCTILFYNLQTISSIECEKELKKINKKRKSKPSKNKKKPNKGYKINRNIGVHTLRNHLLELFTCKDSNLNKVVKRMQATFLRSLELDKNADRERNRSRIRNNDRHVTEWNYKQAI